MMLGGQMPGEMVLENKTQEDAGEPLVRGIFPLNPAESKRLIAKGVAALPVVRRALEAGRLIITAGTTNAYLAEELLGIKVSKFLYASGIVTEGILGVVAEENKIPPYILRDGRLVDLHLKDMLPEMGGDDVIIKGANAVDRDGYAGVLLGGDTAGTIGMVLPVVAARGTHLVVPVGLEKMIPSVVAASRQCGIMRFKYAVGSPVGFMPLVNATVITELQALRLLTGVKATHVGSGGVAGAEGTVVIAVEGPDERVAAAMSLIEGIKGEEAVVKEGMVTVLPLRWGGG